MTSHQAPAESEARDERFTTADGVPLKAWRWARPEPRGMLVIAHGLGEHAACYRHVAEVLGRAAEVDVLAFDFRGHGRSPGRRGLVRRYEDLTLDLKGALDWAKAALPGLPRFVLGHSNGGLVALRTLVEWPDEADGLILSNPSLRLARTVPRHIRLIGAVLLRCAPGITLPTAIGPGEMTRDPEMLAGRADDPLRHTRISAPIYYGMLAAGAHVAARAESIRIPTLMLLGGADPVIDPIASRALFDRLGGPDKALRLYPEMLHEPLNELGRDGVIAEIAEWLSGRLAPGPTQATRRRRSPDDRSAADDDGR